MLKIGDEVYSLSVDIQTEDDWNSFMQIGRDWFVEDAPIDALKIYVLSHPGWMHFMDLDIRYIDDFMDSDEWLALRDSGLAVAIKRCRVTIRGYVSPNDSYSKAWTTRT